MTIKIDMSPETIALFWEAEKLWTFHTVHGAAIEEAGEYIEQLGKSLINKQSLDDPHLVEEFADVLITGLNYMNNRSLMPELERQLKKKMAKLNRKVTSNKLRVEDEG